MSKLHSRLCSYRVLVSCLQNVQRWKFYSTGKFQVLHIAINGGAKTFLAFGIPWICKIHSYITQEMRKKTHSWWFCWLMKQKQKTCFPCVLYVKKRKEKICFSYCVGNLIQEKESREKKAYRRK